MTRNIWSDAELEAAVVSYLNLYGRFAAGEGINREEAYRILSQQYGRTRDAYQYRFRNISHVLDEMSLPMLPGLKPQSHVGVHKPTIRRFIEQSSYFTSHFVDAPTADPEVLNQRAAALLRRGVPSAPPAGSRRPARIRAERTEFVRSPAVKAWVLANAAGHCECCGQPAPFVQEDGTPYLEVHHIKWLAQGGSDTVTNAVALCPNCHRRFHHGADAAALVASVTGRVTRLVREY